MEILSMAGDALLSAAFEWLLQKLDDRLNSNDLQEEVHAELRKWKLSFPRIRAVLNDAEQKQITDSSVKIWLHDLRDLAYDMEDVLDGFRADVQRSTVMAKPHQGCTSKFTLKCFPCFKHNDFVFDSDTISKVKLIAERLQDMIAQSGPLCLVSSTIQAGEKLDRAATGWVPTTPQLESHVYGRRDDKEAILQKLLNGEGGSEAYCVLPIVGMGGIGKTTLARQVYGAVEQENFQLKAWTLLLQNCYVFSKFPATIGNLNDLQYLDITSTPSLKAMPQEIANLKNLLMLPKFIVGKTNGLRLGDVKNLLHLRGYLSILDLQNVSDYLDARRSNLHMIKALDELVLEWTSDFDDSRKGSDIAEEVLSSLSPHQNLKKLTINCYGGKQFPSWIGDQSFCKLSYLRLSGCRNSTLLPSVGQLPALTELIIEGMDAIETVESEIYGRGTFTSLQKLKFHNMLNWEKWAFLTTTGVEFSCLKDLEIANCPKLTGKLPSHRSSLINLVIKGCPELTCPSLSLPSLEKIRIEGCKQVLLESMVNLTSLTMLELSDILGLGCLPKSFTDSLTALENIKIERCQELTYLWEEGADTSKLAHLERMSIVNCPLLVSMSREEQGLVPPNVKYLFLYNCGALKCLPNRMMMRVDGSNNMVRLEELRIENCPCLQRFPRGKLPATCRLLKIKDCAKVESLPEGILVQEDGDNSNNIEELEVTGLPSLNLIPSDDRLPTALKSLEINNCPRLESISERMLQRCLRLECMGIGSCVNLKSLSFSGLSNLTRLYITGCDALESFQEMPELSLSIPSIKNFQIFSCQNLKSLPKKLYNLTSLQELWIGGCPGVTSIPEGGLPPNLTDLSIACENLKQPMREWGLHTLTSLNRFTIGHICPPNNVLPSSLTFLRILDVQNLKSIPRGLLQNLKSLTELCILSCPKLRSLPREGLPPLLGELWINACPLLKREPFQEKGQYWPLTYHIPCVYIEEIQVYNQALLKLRIYK
ncbi:hypothetical protein SLEP1_g53318 [Rubroshorea leprosula]|uniref:Disease resistance RPP13-like protein 1 n=1 Tax=Rubroshorea leprosula TaxID=152421 RepID=A0AAV5MA18_9ROSI|nr:hypothetical protein SLEP1_g53318 [Rubroshorea leprosula]